MNVEFVLSMIYLTKMGLYCRMRVLQMFGLRTNLLDFSILSMVSWRLADSNLRYLACPNSHLLSMLSSKY